MSARSKYAPTWITECADEYRVARYIWECEREAVCIGYATEMREYQETNPSPMYKDFLIEHATRRRRPEMSA